MDSDRGARLVEAVFAPPNKLRLDDVEGSATALTGEVQRLMSQLIEDARAGDDRPILLPRVGDGVTQWYALVADRRLRTVIAEDIKSFVGSTYADLSELFEPLDGDDPIDSAALEWIGSEGASLRFRVPVEQRRAAIGPIAAMRRSWDNRPREVLTASDGTAVMLRALNRAIAGRDSSLAEAALDRVRATGRLSSANVTFSTIRVLEVGSRWARMLNLAELGVVLAIPRPRAVTEALLRAVYWTQLADIVPLGGQPDAQQLDAARVVMSDVILPRYAVLFRAADGLRTGEALLLFALRSAMAVPPRFDEVDHLAGRCDADDPARPVIEGIGRHIRDLADREALPSAESAFAAEAIQAELRLEVEERKTRIREAQGALEAFGRGQSYETASDALVALRGLSPEENDEMASVHRYERIVARVTSLVPPGEVYLVDGWISWANAVRAAPDWPGASDVLELAADSWLIDALLASELAESFALTLMDARSHGGRETAARALDYLVPASEAAVARGLDVTALGARLITVLLADEVVNEADWNFVVSLLEVVLEGADRSSYDEILEEVRSSLADRASPALVDTSLAALEVAAFHRASDPSARDALAGVVIGICDRFAHRLHRDQLAILEIACKDLGGGYEDQARELAQRLRDEARAEEGTDAMAFSLSGKLVGIYSLEEPAAVRARVAIESAYSGVRVETNASEVATPGLRRLAQTADEMIVATRAAKHAATLELDSILRKRRLRPIFPAGKGATSIIRALRDRLAES